MELKYGDKYSHIAFGTLYVNDVPKLFPTNPIDSGDIYTYNEGDVVSLGDTANGFPEYTLRWIKYIDESLNRPVYVCDRNIIKNISYDDIRKLGWNSGSGTVIIDKITYQVGLLHGGEMKDIESQWNTIIGGSPINPNTKNMYSWCSNTATTTDDVELEYITVKGYMERKGWNYRDAKRRNEKVGWRPVLIPKA